MLPPRLTGGLQLFLVMFCVVNKIVALLVIKNIFGLPDYVLGELLASSQISGGHVEALLSDDQNLIDGDHNDVDTVSNNHKLVKFSPRKLNFAEHSIGVPFTERVYVENLNEENSIQMISISGSTVHFHCSFFEEKIVGPTANTSFDVVFLARQEGQVTNTLYIHTSVGSFKYQVSAVGVGSAYRLRPLVGAKVPLNSSYAQTIHIYNPHSYSLQLTEMYSSGGGLHLELPNGADALAETWQVGPFETKAVMRAHFLATTEKKHTAYIRIKTNATDAAGSELVLPVEVEVSSAPGIYSPVDLLDFGVARTSDPIQEMSLQIINAGTKAITIQNIIATPINEAIDIVMTSSSPVRISPNIYHPTEVAKILLDPSKITDCRRQCSGKVVVKSKNNQHKLIVPYQVHLLSGYLAYNESRVQFFINPELTLKSNKVQEKRSFEIANRFNFSVLVHDVALSDEAKPYLKVGLTGSPVILAANETKSIAMVTFMPTKELTQLETYFKLYTNISHFDVKVVCYSGRLDIFIPQSEQQTLVSFGAIGLGEEKSMVFALFNNNPVDILVEHWRSNMTSSSLELVSVDVGKASLALQDSKLADGKNAHPISENLSLKPKHFAVFRLRLKEFLVESHFFGQVTIVTQRETVNVPFNGRAIEGSLAGEAIFVSNSFPGRVSSQTVRVTSSFAAPLVLKSHFVTPLSEGRFTFEPSVPPVINFGDNIVGKLYFDPMKDCAQSKTCYAGLDTLSEVGHLWALGLALHSETGYFDQELFKVHYERWSSITHVNDRSVNSTVNLETDSGHRLRLDASAMMEWPRLVCGGKTYMKFPITRVGDTQVKEVMIENPSNQPLLVQAVLLADYPNADSAIASLESYGWWTESELKALETKPKSYKLIDVSKEDSLEHLKVRSAFQVIPSANSITLLMPVGQRARISISFQPQFEPGNSWAKNMEATVKSSTILLLRNNLTILDAIHLSGEGGMGLLKIGSQLPGLKSLLNFDLQEKHLAKSCKKSSSKSAKESALEPQFTVHKSFNLINYGKLPVRVKRFVIGPHAAVASTSSTRKSTLASVYDKPQGANKMINELIGKSQCQGFGFKVLNCDTLTGQDEEGISITSKDGDQPSDDQVGFVIRPNESKKFFVAFTPDFTVSKTMATLTILTDDDPLEPLNSNETVWDKLWNGFVGTDHGNSVNRTSPRSRRVNRRPPITYSLIATVPKHLLPLCSMAMPRPYQELILYYTLVVFMICLLLISVVLSFFDGARILNFTFYPGLIMSKTVHNCPETFEAFNFETIEKAYKEKDKKNTQENARQRKGGKVVKTGGTSGAHSTDGLNEYSSKIYVSAQSWTSFFAKQLQRRDSSASAGSNGSGSGKNSNGSARNKSGSNPLTRGKINKIVRNKEQTDGSGSSVPQKRPKARSWFSSLGKTAEIKIEDEPTRALPIFDAFDEDERRALKGNKPRKTQNKNEPTLVVPATSTKEQLAKQATPEESSPDTDVSEKLLNGPKSSIAGSSSGCKLPKQIKILERNPFDNEIGYWSNDINSSGRSNGDFGERNEKVIWDSPITMFDAEKAMTELVQQTEHFAKNSKSYRQTKGGKGGQKHESKSALCSFVNEDLESLQPSGSKTGTQRLPRSYTPIGTFDSSLMQNVQHPRPSVSVSPHTISPSWSPSPMSGLRSDTPPGTFSQNSMPQLNNVNEIAASLFMPSVPVSANPASSWLTEALLENERGARENSQWGGQGHGANIDQRSRNMGQQQLPNQSRLKDWTNFNSVDRSNLWESSLVTGQKSDDGGQTKWLLDRTPGSGSPTPPPPPPNSLWSTPSPSPSSQQGNETNWTDDQRPGDSWLGGLLSSKAGHAGHASTTASPPTASTSSSFGSSFSLFGKSLWSPLSPNSESQASTQSASWTFNSSPSPVDSHSSDQQHMASLGAQIAGRKEQREKQPQLEKRH